MTFVRLFFISVLGLSSVAQAQHLPQSERTVQAMNIKEIPKPEPHILQWIQDFQGTDLKKIKVASAGLVARGGTAYRELVKVKQNKKNPVAAQRAVKACEQIDILAKQKMMVARRLNFQFAQKNLTEENLQKVIKAYLELADYTPHVGLRRSAATYVVHLRHQAKKTKEALAALKVLDEKLKAQPAPKLQGVIGASLHAARSQHLITCKRMPEALDAIEAGLALAKGPSRLLPSLLKQKAQILNMTGKKKELESTCRRILKECPGCFETREAYELLIGLYEAQERKEEQLVELKNFLKAFPIDEKAQETLTETLDVYFDVYPDFKTAASLAGFLIKALPSSRLSVEVVRAFAVCNEYGVKDYKLAEHGYQMLKDLYADQVKPDTLQAALERVKKKAAGTFPKGPDAQAKGPEGVFGKFLAALAKQDEDALEELLLEDDADYVILSIEDVTKEALLSDYAIDKVEADEKSGTAKLHVRHFVPAQLAPVKKVILLKKEGETWRVHWPDPDFDDAMDEKGNVIKPGGIVAPPNMPPAKPRQTAPKKNPSTK